MKYEARARPDGEKGKRNKWPLDAEEGKVRRKESAAKKLVERQEGYRGTEQGERETGSEERIEENRRLGKEVEEGYGSEEKSRGRWGVVERQDGTQGKTEKRG